MPSVKRRRPDPDPGEGIWEQHRLTFLRLYQTERRTLKEVKEIMESEHGFPVNSLLTYETKLRNELHLRKKLKKSDWVSVHHHRLKRGDKPTGVYLNGTEIPQHKVWKDIRRSGARLVDNGQDIPLPRDVVVRTPSPVGYLVPHALPKWQEGSQGLSPRLLASSMTMPPAPSSPGALIYSTRNTINSSQSHIGSSINYQAQGGRLAELLEVSSWGVITALWSIPWVKFSNYICHMTATLHCSSEYSRILNLSVSFESLPFTIYFESELESPEAWGAEFLPHKLPLPSHTPSSSALTLNMDIFYLLSKVLHLISNNKLETSHGHFSRCPNAIQLLLDRIPQEVLKSLFLEDLPTIRTAWQYLADCAGKYGHRNAFISLMMVGLVHRNWIIPRGALYLSFAASMNALDVIQSLTKAGIRADGRIKGYQNPAVIEAAATGNIECLKLLLTTCDVNCEVRFGVSTFCIFISALGTRAISTSPKRDHAYPPNSFRKSYDETFMIIQFSLGDKSQSRALDMLLQSGANVDATYKYDFDRISLNPILRDKRPKKYLPTILEQSYYLDVEAFYRLAPYSTQTTRLFFRPDLCLSAKRGCEFLREYWTSRPARLDSDGTAFLELVFAEQFFDKRQAIDTDLIRSLIEFGIGPNLTSLQLGSGYFLWHIVTHARTHGYDEHFAPILTIFIQSGSVIDSNVLEAGVEEEGIDILKLLAQSGANVNKYGVLALSTAARLDNYEAVSWLLEAGADINAVAIIDSVPWSVIGLASTLWRSNIFEEFPEGCSMQETNLASLAMLDHLIDHGAEWKSNSHHSNAAGFLQRLLVHAWDDEWIDPILLDLITFFVSRLDRHDLSSPEVCILADCATLYLSPGHSDLERLGVSLFELFRVHGAPMLNADILPGLICGKSPPGLIQEFLESLGDINTYYIGGHTGFPCTALQAAAYRGNMDLLEQLVSMGANINMPAFEKNGVMTALQAAASKGHMALVERLVRMGANINAPAGPEMGSTALQAACLFDPKSATDRANMIKVIQLLIMKGADVNALPGMKGSYNFGMALQIAAGEGDMEVALLLIQRGADVNAPSQKWSETRYYSALDKAALYGRLDMVQFLLSLGALSHDRGQTGYDGAIQGAESEEHFAIADLIRHHYADDFKLLGTNIARTFLVEI
ncbi:hypothetical protein F4813DRAFT_400096 [Daldinia decipiens]|uniref:uncharacterized protein n=1 Tax=Daldinia decipiens TaxID=326647 RepID=UPI0020C2D3E8|nr:uncharacterized protein F4813DRAFT_400096 [Daldinia decipiens]KAI1660949.1 hypothetical protein F4813DRAFT_400096 [Daldinia decipiens]